MAEPISNLEANYEIIRREGKEIPVIRLDYVRRIFTDHVDDYYKLYKYEVPVLSFDIDQYLEYRGNILKYMNTINRMGGGTFIGGYNPGVPPDVIDITTNIQQGAAYLIDQDIRDGYIYIYEIVYQYEDVQYSVIDLGSLETTPFVSAQDLVEARRSCWTYRNFRYRGPHPTAKYRDMFQEVSQDIKYWDTEIDRLTNLVDNVILYDEYLFQVYYLEDTIRYIIEEGKAYGYGVGKYGAKGGYGI